MTNKPIDLSILKSVRDGFNQDDIFLMLGLIEKMYSEKPYTGFSIFYNAHLTHSSILQIEALIASGADVTITCNPGLRCDPEVVEILKLANTPLVPLADIVKTEFDFAIDCGAGFLTTGITPKYGVVELTQTGVTKYKSAQVTYPVISVDDTEIKKIETYFGTGDGFIRGFHKLTKAGLHNKKFVIMGYGKVGKGIINALTYFTNQITIVENDPKKIGKSASDEFPIYDILDRTNVVSCLKDAYCIITATGVKGLMSKYFDKGIIRAKYLANMGSEDEWGEKFALDEVLNNKLALNFCLQFPTRLQLLDPIFYAQLIAIDTLLQQKLVADIQPLSIEMQLLIISQWILSNHHIDVRGDYFEQILNNIPGFIYWKDRDSVYQGCNTNFARAAGLTTANEIIGKTDYELVWGDTEAEIYRNGDQAALSGQSLLNFEETQLQADGTHKTVLASKIPFQDKENNIVGVLGIYSDITDTKEKERLILESQIHQAAKEEQDKFRRIVGQVLHDVGAPLASIRAIVDSISEIPEQKRIALRTATMNIVDIVHQLLSQFNPHNHDNTEVNRRQPILVSAIQTDILSDRRFKYKHQPIVFESKLTQLNAFIFIKAQPLNFKRSISNLINNAIDALPATGGKIEFGLKADEEWVYISILDDGRGISEDVLEKIKNSLTVTDGKRDGHGIGLTQVHDMLEQNYGTIEIMSSVHEKSHGTTVVLRFPRVIAPDWIAKEIELTKDSIIVILDDNINTHKMWELKLGSILEKMPSITIKYFMDGHEVIKFINTLSEEKLENVCLLSDYELINQELNGLQVIKQCKVKYSVLVTGYFADLNIRKIAIQSGITVLPKDLVHLVPLKMIQLRTKDELANVHMVFVDDDKTIMQTLVTEYYSHLIVDQYSNPFEFLNNVDKYPKETKLIFDNYYYTDDGSTLNIDGITIARKLHEKGYTNLFLLSGEEFSVPEYVTLILKTDAEKIKNLDRL